MSECLKTYRDIFSLEDLLRAVYDMLRIKKKYRLDYDSVIKTEDNER